MSFSKNEFAIMDCIRQGSFANQRELSLGSGISLGGVNSIVRKLTAQGYLDKLSLTEAGLEALFPYKVDNAVILAAGLSSRFAPISYEKPKGLLRVRGEVLIERQIKQLHDAGIDDITVVVGYKKEYFFYLESKFGVSIVVYDDYASRNNHASLMLVRDKLKNTYVCSSDDYFTENPFEPYVYKSYYAVQWAEGKTDEWCLSVGPRQRITGVSIGGEHAWYMLGQAYFDKAFSNRMVRILEEEFERPETIDMLWEDLYKKHIDEFDMEIRPFPDGVINEFDSLDELISFDPMFLDNVDSEIFDNIVRVLGCQRSEIHDVYPLKQGLTNLSCHFSTDSGEYVYRHPGVGTELLIDRNGEVAAQTAAKELGIDDTFIFEDPKKGWKISRFIKHCRNLNPHDYTELSRAMDMGRRLHEEKMSLDRTFEFYEEALRYKGLLLEKGPVDIPGFEEMSNQFDELGSYLLNDRAPKCLCHNDFFYLNFLIDENGKFYLIDWEYAGMGDYANDFGTFCVCCELSYEEAVSALAAYFGREPTRAELVHNLAMVAMAGWCWYLWSLLKESEGDNVGEWLYIYFNYAKRYLSKALPMYREMGRD